MSTLNPFTANSVLLDTGFYFDKGDYQIIYLHKDNSYENSFVQTYSKFNRPVNTEMLVELSTVESTLTMMDKDFEWICKSESVRESFVDFMLENELYLLMAQFKAFCSVCSAEDKNQDHPFKYKDIVEAVDNYYELTRKDQNFVGEIVGVLKDGTVHVRILKHDQAKYVGLVVKVKEYQHIRKIN